MNKIIPTSGAWIMTTKAIPIEYPIEPFSIYFAKPKKTFQYGELTPSFVWGNDPRLMSYVSIESKKKFGGREALLRNYAAFLNKEKVIWTEDQREVLIFLEDHYFEVEQRVEIRTVWDDCCIEPHEYVVIDMNVYNSLVDQEHLFLNLFADVNGITDKELRDKIFYMRSRGLSYADAVQLILPHVNEPNILWLTFHEEYQKSMCRDYDIYEGIRDKYENKKLKADSSAQFEIVP